MHRSTSGLLLFPPPSLLLTFPISFPSTTTTTYYYWLILLLTLPSKVANQCLSLSFTLSIESGVKLTSRLPTRPLSSLPLSHLIYTLILTLRLVPLFSSSSSSFPPFLFTFPHTVFVLQAGLCSSTDSITTIIITITTPTLLFSLWVVQSNLSTFHYYRPGSGSAPAIPGFPPLLPFNLLVVILRHCHETTTTSSP